MVSSLVSFLVALRFNKSSVVRRSILVTLHAIAEVVPTFMLFDTPEPTSSEDALPFSKQITTSQPMPKQTNRTAQEVNELLLWAQSM